MVTFTSQFSFLWLLFLFTTTIHISMSSNHRAVHCNKKDRETLSIFKQGITNSSDHLSTWSNEEDCCAWKGVQCDNITGRVTKLDLQRFSLKGEINLCLLELEFLNYLDLSYNYFDVISIPPSPHNVTFASNLLYLDLSWNYGFLQMDNLHWLSPLSSLKYLNLSYIDLHKETNWLQLVAMLPSLSELRLRDCSLSYISPSLKYVNFTSLVTLDLSFNNFNSELPYWLFNLSSGISHLELHYHTGNNLQMDNLHWLSQHSSLKYLDLSGNISPSLKYVNFTSLVTLDLSNNNFNSELPYWLFHLSSTDISYLDLSYNSIHGEIPSSLLNLQNLNYLDLSGNKLEGSIPNWFGQQEHLQSLDLSNNLFSGSFPSALENLSSLVSLSIGSNSFSGAICEPFLSKLSKLEDLDLSNSTFAFHLDPEWIPPFQLSGLSLGNTNQGPNFPSWIYTQNSLQWLDISSSGISSVDGDMFRSFIAGHYWSYLSMSNSSISEDISNVTLNCSFIRLDHNNFTGGLPHILPKATDVDLSDNSFSGPIPRGWENLNNLVYINLWSNRLSGEVIVDLSNFMNLEVMILGKNEFSGTIPIKIPQKLQVMILRSNHFVGNIPPQLFNLSTLFHLDLSLNKLSGSMPRCVFNVTRMATDYYPSYGMLGGYVILLHTKGQDYDDYEVNPDRRTIDLSANNLSGKIPLGLYGLTEIQTLNLSHNHFTGTIQKEIGDMKNLESLDLSNNNLYGEIPQSMAGLSFLGYLNLSCNNFNGQIPIGTQLQSFNASSYIGNPEFCGAPLSNCITQEEIPKDTNKDAENEDGGIERESLCLGMGVGFAVGFWGICGSFLLIRKWRQTYYRFLDHMGDQLYVTLMVKFNNFRKAEVPAS
ncbi:receptor-like protein EIX2 [Gastrolobium bilobum]|uniref:receptor-like protein EIX2 n=1 Tax=Gastrolobium bilobum TaxID=150636 RepID=UPI002AB091C4|nr:receptor-like protein EIX2 [Gastrolobium bilobum]